ncbi:MAG: phosphoglycerate dehydrogenase [Candidatus Heteroscillospira sp.]|jgi:D-3-phosphoglycerate dehydrogenase
MYKVKTLNNIAQIGLDYLDESGIRVSSEMEKPEGILVRSADMHSYERNKELLAIARAGAGTNNIPIQDCTEEGIVVFNTPGANAEAVKEMAVCAILMASRDVYGGVEWAKSLSPDENVPALVEKGKGSFAGPEITGKTLGVIGLGAVGAKIANTALELGMMVYGYDPYLSVDAAWKLSGSVKHARDLDTIYRNCDYITLHVPYLPDTHHMLSDAAFDKMRDGVRIINLARGELVDDDAMLRALDSGRVARYVTDFPNSKTIGFPNTIPLPHLGASTPESEEKCALMAARELADYLENGNIKNSVNLPKVKLERMGVARLCVIHRNVPRTLNKILDIVAEQNINVEHMINKPRGEYAYTMIDTGSPIDGKAADKISGIDNVFRVRVL